MLGQARNKFFAIFVLGILLSFLTPGIHAQTACVQSAASTWVNKSVTAQNAQFTATFDATPTQAAEDTVVAFSLNAAADYTKLAAIVRFATTGTIDARNGAAYSANVSVPYSAGSSYHFRLVINPSAKTYSVYVTPAGQGEVTLGTGYVFRSEQSTTSSLNNWVIYGLSGGVSVCNMTMTSANAAPAITSQPTNQTVVAGQTGTFSVGASGTAPLSYQWRKNGSDISGATSASYSTPATANTDNGSQFSVVVSNSSGNATSNNATLTVNAATTCTQTSGTSWTNSPFVTQTGDFTAVYDATPGIAKMDGVVGLSLNSANNYTNLAAIVRFSPTGVIDARNGKDYAAGVNLAYVAGSSYHFRLVISPSAKTYSVYVTAPGQAEVAVATNYAFRSEQSNASSLNNWAMVALSGNVSVCNMVIVPFQSAPLITSQPANQTVVPGQTATFSAGASGTNPMTYQWRKNGATISGATSSSYTTPATTTTDNGALFSVVVNNSVGSATSSNATLTVSAITKTLTLNPTSLSFGNVNTISNSTLSTTITNTGNSNVTISNVGFSGAGFTVSGLSTGQIIGAGKTATLNVNFAPASAASVTGSVVVSSDASNSPGSLSLSGVGVQLVTHSTNLTWSASPSTVMGYNVYSSTVAGGPYAKITGGPVSGITYKDTTVQSGKTYYYVVTSVSSGSVESTYSNQVSAAIP